MREEWRPVPGYEGLYEVSNLGRVRGLKRGRILRGRTLPNGYRQVSLWRCNQEVFRYIHRLVLEAFVGPCPEGRETLHGNNDRADNRLCNLRWGTRSENQRQVVADGRHGSYIDGRSYDRPAYIRQWWREHGPRINAARRAARRRAKQ